MKKNTDTFDGTFAGETLSPSLKQVRTKRSKGDLAYRSFTLDQDARSNMAFLKTFYAGLIGREASSSIILRRALEGLVAHVSRLDGEQAQHEEAFNLMRQAGR